MMMDRRTGVTLYAFSTILQMAGAYKWLQKRQKSIGSLDAGFKQVELVQNFWNFHIIDIEHY